MRLKSKYRQAFKDGGRVDLPGQEELQIEQPIETVSAPPEAPAPTVDEPPAPQPEQPQQDDATLALKRQIEELRQSEQAQRQQAELLQQPQPVTREQKLQLWKQSGLSEEEANFLQQNPSMIDFAELTGLAVSQAERAGHKRGEPSHLDAVKKIFDVNFERLQAEENHPVMHQPTPKFFRPPAPPKEAYIVSAPVSREVPTSDGRRPRGRVTLSREEQEAARMSGLTLEEYAMQKRKYQDMRESGEYRDERR